MTSGLFGEPHHTFHIRLICLALLFFLAPLSQGEDGDTSASSLLSQLAAIGSRSEPLASADTVLEIAQLRLIIGDIRAAETAMDWNEAEELYLEVELAALRLAALVSTSDEVSLCRESAAAGLLRLAVMLGERGEWLLFDQYASSIIALYPDTPSARTASILKRRGTLRATRTALR